MSNYIQKTKHPGTGQIEDSDEHLGSVYPEEVLYTPQPKEEEIKMCDCPKGGQTCENCGGRYYVKALTLQSEGEGASHSTRDGWCCACEYDIAVFEGKIKEARQEERKEIGKIVNKLSFDFINFEPTEEARAYTDLIIKRVKNALLSSLKQHLTTHGK